MSGLERVDGGDRACGELLLVLAARVRELPAGSLIRLVATDPAAAIDLPAWCHLTGHDFVGRSFDEGRPCYDLRTAHQPRPIDPASPWRLDSRQPAAPNERGNAFA